LSTTTQSETAVEEVRTESEVQTESQLKDPEVIALFKSVRESAVRVRELMDMEKAFTSDVINVLREFIEPLGRSYHLDPSLLSKIDPNVVDIVLTPQGSICLIYGNGSMITRSLENLSSESLMRVLTQILPEVKISLEERRQKLSLRTSFLEQVSGEIKDMPNLSSKRQK
jgi:hypothetical protein